ncbi:SH3 domain-containing protein [Jeotgalibacillus soli]|nr:SH3 domain-containing protein [Jeotgalibacillus soli]
MITNAEGPMATIAADVVNMREGPGLSFPTVATANNGDTYDIVDNEYGWLKLTDSNGQSGWVAEWLVVQEEVTSSNETAASQDSTLATVSVNELRVRTGPGIDHEVIGLLSANTNVNVLARSGEWVEISLDSGNSGWVNGDYLEGLTSTEQRNSDETADVSRGTVSVDRLNVRSDFSSEGQVIGSLNQGDTVTIEDEQYGWLLVEGNGLKGWVSSSYVQRQSTSSEETAASSSPVSSLEGSNVVILVDSLNVRDEPSQLSNVIGTLAKGDTYKINQVNGDWYEIEWDSGKKGWIASWFVEQTTAAATESDSTSDQAIESNETVTILYNGSNIRATPNVESKVTARGQAGEQYAVINQQGDWFEIELADGSTGFIANWIVSPNDERLPEEIENDETEQDETVIQSIADATIVIDAGHGGRDSGAIGASGTLEKILTLRTAEILYHKLANTGANVIMTRQDDRYIDLHSRVFLSQLHDADAFVSLHYDAIDDRNIRGFTTYFYGEGDQPLAESVHEGLENQLTIRDRGVQFGDYLVIRDNAVPAILLELGYISNPSEEAAIANDRFRESATTGIYNGLVEYFTQ